MAIKVENIKLNYLDSFGKNLIIPVDYLAYINDEGKIKNIRGDYFEFEKKLIKYNKNIFKITFENFSIQTDKIFNCDLEEINLCKLVFLINNKFYNILGEEIKIKEYN